MKLSPPTIGKIQFVFSHVEGVGFFENTVLEPTWLHCFSEDFILDLARVQRLSIGLMLDDLSPNRTIEFETVEPVVDVLHYQGMSCYCLIQHPIQSDCFHFFSWSMSDSTMDAGLPKAYLIRDILLQEGM